MCAQVCLADIQLDSNKFSIESHYFKVLVQIHYSLFFKIDLIIECHHFRARTITKLDLNK